MRPPFLLVLLAALIATAAAARGLAEAATTDPSQLLQQQLASTMSGRVAAAKAVIAATSQQPWVPTGIEAEQIAAARAAAEQALNSSSSGKVSALAAVPAPPKQPKQAWTKATILATFPKVPFGDMLNPLQPLSSTYPRLSGSPSSNCILNFGGAANDGTDNAAAIERAASANAAYLYLPATAKRNGQAQYRISRSVTLSKMLVASCGASFVIDAGVTLTITAQPRLACRSQPIFTGDGAVKFVGSFEVWPTWFATASQGSAGIQEAADSCSTACTLMLTGWMGLSQTAYLNPQNGVLTTFAAAIWHSGGDGFNTLALRAGNYQRQIVLNTFGSAKGGSVLVQGGVTNAKILIGRIVAASVGVPMEGVIFAPGNAVITGVTVQLIAACSNVLNCVVIQGPGRLQNVQVNVNFGVQSNVLRFRGPQPPVLTNVAVRLQAFEPNQLRGIAALRSDIAGVIKSLTFEVSPWAGNLASTPTVAPFVSGKFAQLSAIFALSGGDPNGVFNLAGSANPIGPRGMSAGAINGAGLFVRTVTSLASMRQCCYWTVGEDVNQGNQVTTAMWPQALYGRAAIASPWAPRQTREFYFRSWWSVGASAAQMYAIPYRGYNPGLVVTGFTNYHLRSKGKQAYTVGVRVTNLSGSTISSIAGAGTWFRFGMQIGPR